MLIAFLGLLVAFHKDIDFLQINLFYYFIYCIYYLFIVYIIHIYIIILHIIKTAA